MGKFGGFWKRGKKENEPDAISKKELFKAAEWCLKGDSQSIFGHFDEAVKCYDKALEINPQNADAWLNKGSAQDQLGLRDAVIHSYRVFIKVAPAQLAETIELVRQRLRELEGD